MTQGGTVVFADEQEYTWYVIDAPGLATGWMTLTEFGSNGNIRAFTLRQPWNMGQMMSFGQMLGRRALKLAMLGTGGPPQYNEPYFGMDLPILELLELTRQGNKFLNQGYGNRDLWVRIIEQSAAGYLNLEAQVREVEFGLDDLLEVGF
ncbi:uncharacterized protein N7529_011534 [Penicillium soppii]|uniref:uncharacterized protein n=1 Tax=Penicillium soppii TaxID=69789 RepID=UPI0025496F0A|nr:uncharacterized protein N7529_011534 [Penicillium soppii]KAJ5852149.1 hypothetical protein N7529_011534 [Penicillium soppii]